MSDNIDKIKQTILGEDDKLDKSDIDRLASEVKESKLGKTVLGEDGKFDKEDMERLAEGAKASVKNASDKIKELFSE